MSNLIDRLHQDHVNMARLLDLLERELKAVQRGKGGDYQLMKDIMHYMRHYPDLFHHPREDILFAELVGTDDEAGKLVQGLLIEHRRLAELGKAFLESLESVADGSLTPREGIIQQGQEYLESQRKHIDEEEGHAFPLARKLLDEDSLNRIDSAHQSPGDPLFGEALEDEYRLLYQYLRQHD